MTAKELAFNKAAKSISEFMPTLRYYFKEVAIQCEHLGREYEELKNSEVEIDDFESLQDEVNRGHVEFLELAWGLADSIKHIELECDDCSYGHEIMDEFFDGSYSTTYIMGEVMMLFLKACKWEDPKRMNNLADKLRATLARIENFVKENTDQKGE